MDDVRVWNRLGEREKDMKLKRRKGTLLGGEGEPSPSYCYPGQRRGGELHTVCNYKASLTVTVCKYLKREQSSKRDDVVSIAVLSQHMPIRL